MTFFYNRGVQVMIKNLEQVVSMVLNSFQDSHPRVRWAAINAIGQLSTDLGPDLQTQYHHRVLPALASAMDDFQNPRVQVNLLMNNIKCVFAVCTVKDVRFSPFIQTLSSSLGGSHSHDVACLMCIPFQARNACVVSSIKNLCIEGKITSFISNFFS